METKEKAKANKVKAQSPGAGKTVDKHSTVNLHVWVYKLVEVPNVKGQRKGDAVGKLAWSGLKSKVFDVPTKNQEDDGIVQAQSPVAGTAVDRGTLVTLGAWKYQGKRFTVPNVVNMELDAATNKLTSVGFTNIKTSHKFTKERSKFRKVQAQTPRPLQTVPKGSPVTLVVWRVKRATSSTRAAPGPP